MDILKTNLAPISTKAWEIINTQARNVFNTALAARKFVDVDGPRGWDFPAVTVGRLIVPEKLKPEALQYGINSVLPLIETRKTFILDIWELDNAERGAEDLNLLQMENAAREIAAFEDSVIINGFEESCVLGLKKSSAHETIPLPNDPEQILEAVSQGISKLIESSIEGPYSLIASMDLWKKINVYVRGYPLRKHLENLLGGSIILSASVNETFLISTRGNDFRLTLGADLSIGYNSHSSKEVTLYFTESFTFQVIEPLAVLFFTHK